MFAIMAPTILLFLAFFIINNLSARTKITKAQTKLLAEIAKAQNVDPAVIDGILKEMN